LAAPAKITFLFTDVEGSTRLLERDREAADRALARHHQLLSDSVTASRGTIFETVGDAVYAAFDEPLDAIAAAVDGQRRMASEDWGAAGPMRVRIALHVGEVERRGHRYFGVPLFLAARLLGLAHGGQTLASGPLAEAVSDRLDSAVPGSRLRPLGRHRVKDLREPLVVYQVDARGLPGDFAPLRSLGAAHLPGLSTVFRGRSSELGAIARLLVDERTRLLTLTGPGGSGKTRLAIEAASRAADGYPDGVWWVSLGAVVDPVLVLPTVGAAVGAEGDVVRHLEDWRALLVLDNLEQIPDVGVEVARLLIGCPELRVIATSREPLHLGGEVNWPVPPLGEQEAVALFRERATAVRPDLVVDDGIAASICRAVDELPLAIELAASRVNILSQVDLLHRLEHRLPVLSRGPADLEDRHRTLRATIAWSEDLLSPAERALFAQLAVFAGGFDLAAAEGVADVELDVLAGLVDKSLVRRDGDRFEMLATIREYALERFDALADAQAVRARHAEYFAGLARAATVAETEGLGHAERDRLETDLPNVRAAVEWALRSPEPRLAIALVPSAFSFWILRQHGREAVEYGRRLRPLVDDLPGPERAEALACLGELERFYGDLEEAIRSKEAALEVPALDEGLTAATHADLADLYRRLARHDMAARHADASLAIRRRSGTGVAHALSAVGTVALSRGDVAAAVRVYEEAITLESGGLTRTWILIEGAEAQRRDGNLLRARAFLAAATLALRRDPEALLCLFAIETAAGLAQASGEPARALRYGAIARQAHFLTGVSPGFPDEFGRVVNAASAEVDAAEADAAITVAREIPLEVAVDEIDAWLGSDAG
jgi:predicted ATPase/class 3 adenylate cyclase